VGTDVFVSDDPFNFDIESRIGHIASHALEVVTDGEKQYVSHAGWGQGGVYLALLYWDGRGLTWDNQFATFYANYCTTYESFCNTYI
jgi:hypothetical protein